MKLTLADLLVITFLFIVSLGFAYLAGDALDKEEKGRQTQIETHKFHNKYGE